MLIPGSVLRVGIRTEPMRVAARRQHDGAPDVKIGKLFLQASQCDDVIADQIGQKRAA